MLGPLMKLISSLTIVAVVGFLLAIFTAQTGCSSDCASNCPASTVYVGSTDGANVDVAFDVYGPACPPESSVVCLGSPGSGYCTYTTVTGQTMGGCDVLVAFNPYTDGRPWEIIHLQYAAPSNAPGTCCGGYPVVGPSTYVIPDHPSQGGVYGTFDGGQKIYSGITYADGGASADPDAARPGGGADAGADALPGG
jgi:hypothetical protein